VAAATAGLVNLGAFAVVGAAGPLGFSEAVVRADTARVPWVTGLSAAAHPVLLLAVPAAVAASSLIWTGE
jgi:hypothetical protein